MFLNIFVDNTVSIRRDVSGNLLSGYGYVIAPNFRQLRNNSWSTITRNGQSLARLPLEPSNLSTSSVAFFSFTNDTNYDQVRITGGFTHSPIYIDLNVSAPLTGGNIASVELLVDGESSNELTLNSSPYNFAWIPDVAKDYSLSVAVTDDTGGRKLTSLGSYSIRQFFGGGISATFNGDANITIPSNGTFLLSVDASSEYGIKEVEFFINNISVGKVFDQGLPTFITMVDLSQFNFGEGVHQISMVATDYQGNQAGTFNSSLTNLTSRQNKTLIALPFLPPSQKPVTAISYPPNGFSTTSTSMIRLEANASDPDGSLEGVQFYVNGVVQDAWSGILDFNGTVPADGQLLTIDDGTGKAPVTFEFDNDQTLTGGGTANLVATQGNQLDDLSIGGTYTGYEAKNYIIEIDGIGTPNTFRWSKDGGVTFVNENVSITGAAQTLENGLSGTFTATIGHGLGDRWMIQASAVTVRVPIETDGAFLLANVRRTRDALRESIENQSNIGLLSIFTNDEATDDKLYLYHKMDQFLSGTTSVSGTSLTSGGAGGTIHLYDNDFEPNNNLPDNLIRRDHSYGLPFYPFGRTWTPGVPGTYYIYSVAMDTISRNLVMSDPIVVTATSGTGMVPTIELDPVSSPMIYSGTPQTVQLKASPNDPDGKVIEVRFYANGRQIRRDATSPYEADFDFNASGHYEVYAVVSDDDGNDITSTVQRIVVNTDNEPQYNPVEITPPSSTYLGGIASILSTYKSSTGSYDPTLFARIYINGQDMGLATQLPYSPPSSSQKDPGQTFIFDMAARSTGQQTFEILVFDGNETISMTSSFNILVNPLVDDDSFVVDVYQGIYGRPPESFEQSFWVQQLSNGTIIREQLFEQLRTREEFKKASDIMVSHKTTVGNWATLEDILGSASNPSSASDDHADFRANATKISFNQTIQGRIDNEQDIDFFRIDSLTPGASDGVLTLTVSPGHPLGMYVGNYGTISGTTPTGDINQGYAGSRSALSPSGGFELSWDLTRYSMVDDYTFYIVGSPFPAGQVSDPYTGSYTLTLSNPIAQSQAGAITQSLMDELSQQVTSPVNNFSIFGSALGGVSYIPSILNGSLYEDQYGAIGTHNPEEFFVRLFKNKYEQDPSPVQTVRGVELLKSANTTQVQFLQNFSLDNSVMSVGGFNYTSNLSIPNVPLDSSAFSETALVFGALIGRAPTNAEVAKLTLTPQYEVRCLSKRVKLIMEMPAYGARYGLAMPEVDFIGVQNGRSYVTGGGETVLIEAVSQGADKLAGTLDDGKVHEIEVYLNGKLEGNMSNLTAGTFYYEFTMPTDLASGEYLLEVEAEDANGLKSRAERHITLLGTGDPGLSLTSPATGTVLEKGDSVSFGFDANESVTTYLEINGDVQWKGRLAFNGTNLPADESNVTITDGTGRQSVTFEFDSDGTASATTVGSAEAMSVSGTGTLTASGTYLGTEAREYLVEIDSDGSPDTFRWSVNGGAQFNDSQIPVKANQLISLSSGVKISFSSTTGGKLGDRWRIKVYPNNKIVEIHRIGTFSERLEGTKENLIRAINRARNEGKLSIFAEEMSTTANSGGGFPNQATDRFTIELCREGGYPLRESITVTPSATPVSALISEDCLALSTSNGTSGVLSLDMSKCFNLCSPVIEVRLIAFDSGGNAGYSVPQFYEVRNPERLSAELIDPLGRPAVLRLKESFVSGGLNASMIEIVDKGLGYTAETFQVTILSSSGKNGDLNASFDENGSISELHVVVAGSGYAQGDILICSSPVQYFTGEAITLRARVNDPLGELDRVAFYGNGVEIPGTPIAYGDEYRLTFIPTSETISFFSARALFGDQRDNPPSILPSSSCGCSSSFYEDCEFSGQSCWGWRRSWEQQHCTPFNYICPPWYWGNTSYWAWPPPWHSLPTLPGGLAVQPSSLSPNVVASFLSPSPTDLSMNNFILGTQIEISIMATATVGTIERIELFVDGQPLNLQVQFPPDDPITGQYSRNGVYGFSWTPQRPGEYELSVQVFNELGDVSEITEYSKAKVIIGAESQGEVPVIIMTEPVPGGFGDVTPDYSFGSELFINVEAYDPDGDLEYVQIYYNGQLLGDAQGRFGNTYVYRWKIDKTINASQENFVIQAIAKDNDGNIVRSSTLGGINYENNEERRPEVRMDRVSVDQNGILLRAVAGSPSNSFFSGISRVQFFANGVTIDAVGSPTTFLPSGEEEYELSWKPTKAGIYSFYAMAVGNVVSTGDHYVIGDPIIFEVTEQHIASFNSENVPPEISLISPGSLSSGIARSKVDIGSILDSSSADYRKLKNLEMESFGYGYTSEPEVIFYGGAGIGASATSMIRNGAVTKIKINNNGEGYPDTLSLQPSTVVNGSGLVITPIVKNGILTSIPISSGGRGYSADDLVNIFDLQNEAYSGSGARAIPVVDENGSVLSLKILEHGENYNPYYLRVSIISKGTGFEANSTAATIKNGVVTDIKIIDPGSGYDAGFSLSPITGTEGAGFGLNAEVSAGDIKDGAITLALNSAGSGYTSIPKVILKGGKVNSLDTPLYFVEKTRDHLIKIFYFYKYLLVFL